MNDVERWVNLEGEPPAWIAELLDAARGPAVLTRAEADRMEREFHAALAVERRKRRAAARKKKAALAIGAVVVTGAVAAGIVVVAKGLPRDARDAPDTLAPARIGPALGEPAGGEPAGGAPAATVTSRRRP